MKAHVIQPFTPKASKVSIHASARNRRRYRLIREMLKFPPRGKPLLDAINKGFPIQMLRDVAGTLSVDVYKVGKYIDIKTATLDRRLRDGTLTIDESDRLYRFTEVYDAALDLCDGNSEMAVQWLNTPALGLGGEIPISVIRTSTGANDVLSLIHKIEHGVLV